jgi:hypothetical protein
LASGAGAASRNSIGLVLVGGMAVGTMFTLLVIPSIYMLIAREHVRTAAAAAIPHDMETACILPQFNDFKLPVGCSLTARENCQWTINCNPPKVVELKKKTA